MLYKVNTHELYWYNCCYTVEADSEKEAQELVESGCGNLEYSDYDNTDQVDIDSIEELKE